MEQLDLFARDVNDPEKYLEGVKIILARMDTNPEEFSLNDGRWCTLLRDVFANPHGEYGGISTALTPGEVKAITDKYREITRTNFTSKVLKTLSGSNEQYEIKEVSVGSVLGKFSVKKDIANMLNQAYADAYKEKMKP